jgi:hypothetical protein
LVARACRHHWTFVWLKIVSESHDDYADLHRELPVLVEFLSKIDQRQRKT